MSLRKGQLKWTVCLNFLSSVLNFTLKSYFMSEISVKKQHFEIKRLNFLSKKAPNVFDCGACTRTKLNSNNAHKKTKRKIE